MTANRQDAARVTLEGSERGAMTFPESARMLMGGIMPELFPGLGRVLMRSGTAAGPSPCRAAIGTRAAVVSLAR